MQFNATEIFVYGTIGTSLTGGIVWLAANDPSQSP